jgi:hypothetical protein
MLTLVAKGFRARWLTGDTDRLPTESNRCISFDFLSMHHAIIKIVKPLKLRGFLILPLLDASDFLIVFQAD